MTTAIIIYDTKYGNTRRVADAIKEGIEDSKDIECVLTSIEGTHTSTLLRYDVILFGCPNHNQAPSLTMTRHIERIAKVGLSGKSGAVFDTYMGHNKGVAVKKLEALIREILPGLRLLVDGFSARVMTRTGPVTEEDLLNAREFGKRIAGLI